MSEKRTAVILHADRSRSENVENTLKIFGESGVFGRIVLYRTEGSKTADAVPGLEIRTIPGDLDNESKIRNFVNAEFADCGGFLHVVRDDVKVLRSPSKFVADVEKMMEILDYDVWLSTVTDGCNYVLLKYNPRLYIAMNHEEINRKLGIDFDVCVTSHSNTFWTIYNMPKLKGSGLLKFDEKFSVQMFSIIEFLARRRASAKPGDLYFMNQYFTVSSEYGVFTSIYTQGDDPQPSQEKMKEEDAVFKRMNVDYRPNTSLDEVMETFWRKLSGED